MYLNCDSPDPRQGPEPPFSRKEGFGVKKPAFPSALTRAGKGSFRSKDPHVRCVPLQQRGDFLTENSLFLFQDEGKTGFLDPETLFSRKGGFGACLGSGESQYLNQEFPHIFVVVVSLVVILSNWVCDIGSTRSQNRTRAKIGSEQSEPPESFFWDR